MCLKKEKIIYNKDATICVDIKTVYWRRCQNVLRKRLKVINKLGNDLVISLFIAYAMHYILQYINNNYIAISFILKLNIIIIYILQIVIVIFSLLIIFIILLYVLDMDHRFQKKIKNNIWKS